MTNMNEFKDLEQELSPLELKKLAKIQKQIDKKMKKMENTSKKDSAAAETNAMFGGRKNKRKFMPSQLKFKSRLLTALRPKIEEPVSEVPTLVAAKKQ